MVGLRAMVIGEKFKMESVVDACIQLAVPSLAYDSEAAISRERCDRRVGCI